MKMKSITGKPVLVHSKCGMHGLWIDTKWTDVPDSMLMQAMQKNCIPQNATEDDFILSKAMDQENEARASIRLVMRALKTMDAEPKEGDYTGAGIPNLKKVSGYAGFQVSREQLAEAMGYIEADKARDARDND